MFQHDGTMCCSSCFEEMLILLEDNDNNPIAYICPNCMKITTKIDEL